MEDIKSYPQGVKTEIHGELQKAIYSLAPRKTYEKGQVIYRQGEDPGLFYCLEQGRARIFMNSPDGLEKTLGTAYPGEILGEAAFFALSPRVSSAMALKRSVVALIDRDKFREIVHLYPDFAMELLRSQAQRINLLSDQLDSMVFLKADARIARLLYRHKTVVNGSQTVRLSHEEIGNMAGAARVTVSRILDSFRDMGIIETGYAEIKIINPKMLKQTGKISD